MQVAERVKHRIEKRLKLIEAGRVRAPGESLLEAALLQHLHRHAGGVVGWKVLEHLDDVGVFQVAKRRGGLLELA